MASDLGGTGDARVRVVRAADPVAEAAHLAAELDADVALDEQAVTAAVAARVDAARLLATPGEGDDDAVLARADAIRAAAAAGSAIDGTDADELRRLAHQMAAAARIRERTETKVAEVLQARVATSSGVALHPAALVAASEAVVAAEAALADAERKLLEHGAPPSEGGDAGARLAATAEAAAADPVLAPHDDFDEARLERRRTVRNAAIVVVVVAALAAAGIALGAPVAVVAAAAVVVAVVAVLLVGRLARRGDVGEADARANLAAVAAAVAATDTGQRAASLPAEDGGASAAMDAWVERRARLEAARDEATERVRVARNRWHQLAGPDADPHDPDSVVRAHDAQFTYGPRALEASPSVRTVAALHRRTRARWRVLWASLGHDEPPSPEAIDEVLARARARRRAAQAELERLEAAEARRAAAALVGRPLVLVEPGSWGVDLDELASGVECPIVAVEKGEPGVS